MQLNVIRTGLRGGATQVVLGLAPLWRNLVMRYQTLPLRRLSSVSIQAEETAADRNSRYGDELGPGQEAAQVAGGRLAQHGRLGGALEDLPLVVQEGFGEGLRSRETGEASEREEV